MNNKSCLSQPISLSPSHLQSVGYQLLWSPVIMSLVPHLIPCIFPKMIQVVTTYKFVLSTCRVLCTALLVFKLLSLFTSKFNWSGRCVSSEHTSHSFLFPHRFLSLSPPFEPKQSATIDKKQHWWFFSIKTS